MNIREFSLNLQKIYGDITETFSSAQQSSGLTCPSGCGKCCQNPDVEASELEMIPWALKIYDSREVDPWLKRLTTSSQDFCLNFVPSGQNGSGKCGAYNERPMVCRVFGVAGSLNKHGDTVPVICKFLKSEYPEHSIDKKNLPLIQTWSTQLSTLDPELNKKIPINEAMRKALEKIAFYAQFQDL